MVIRTKGSLFIDSHAASKRAMTVKAEKIPSGLRKYNKKGVFTQNFGHMKILK